jgi:dethiobiotin synthetase
VGNAIFLAGTDTDAGKTVAALSLCHALCEKGLKVGVFKPAETGCAPHTPPDALALIEASGCKAPLDTVCPYRLPEPMASAIAAKRAGVQINLDKLARALSELTATHDIVVCEGAGGLLVPFADGLLTADWLEQMKLPVVLVGRLELGTINHTLLSARYLQAKGIEFIGTVLSATKAPEGAAAATNEEVLSSYPEVKLLGVLPFAPSPTMPDTAVEAVLRHVN